MNTGEIEQALCADPFARQQFAGFSFPDAPIEISEFPAFTVINTDLSQGPGEHWCVAYFNEKKQCDYFDPLGFPPDNPLMKYNITHILTQFKNRVKFTDVPVQALNRKTCGDHCIYFSILRCRGESFEKILRVHYVPGNTKINDLRAVQFTSQYGIRPGNR